MATTYTDLVTKLEAELASGSLETKEVEVDGLRRVFRSFNDVLAFLEFAKKQAATEVSESNRPAGRIQWRSRRP